MKDYQRLTDKYCTCPACKNGKCTEPRYDCEEREYCVAWNRLFELENKIESGELCDKKQIEEFQDFCEKEKIKEIFYEFIFAVKNLDHDALIQHLYFMVKAYCPQNIKLLLDRYSKKDEKQ